MTTMGKVDTSDLMMIIRWVMDIFFLFILDSIPGLIPGFKILGFGATYIRSLIVQSTPVISCQLGAKIRDRKLSGSPVISRFWAKAQTRDFQDQSPTL